MKILQVNSVCGTCSTGRIAANIKNKSMNLVMRVSLLMNVALPTELIMQLESEAYLKTLSILFKLDCLIIMDSLKNLPPEDLYKSLIN